MPIMNHIKKRLFSATRFPKPLRNQTLLNATTSTAAVVPSAAPKDAPWSIDDPFHKEEHDSYKRRFSSQASTEALAEAIRELDHPYQEVKRATDPNVIHPQPMWEFNASRQQWVPHDPVPVTNPNLFRNGAVARPQKIHLVTWNLDSKEERPRARANALLNHILGSRDPRADVIFLQEVKSEVMRLMIEHEGIQREWFLTDVDERNWFDQPHGTVALFRKGRFQRWPTQRGYPKTCSLVLGQVKRIRVQSRIQRTLLSCDIHPVPTPFGVRNNPNGDKCMRLINVHLDCEHHPWPTNHRPYQVLAAATAISEAGNLGVVAGDFNAIQAQDENLLRENGLVDAWVHKHSCEGGQTYGHWRRRDKVGVKGMGVERVEIMEPGVVMKVDETTGELEDERVVEVKWSDHNGIKCTVGWENGWDSM